MTARELNMGNMTEYAECSPVRTEYHPHFFPYIRGFLVIGIGTTLTDICLLLILTEWVGVWYLFSALISYCTGALLSYILNKNLNYRNRSSSYGNQGMMFLCISGCGMALNLGIVYLGVAVLGISYLLAKVIATGIGFFVNYYGQTYITFRVWR